MDPRSPISYSSAQHQAQGQARAARDSEHRCRCHSGQHNVGSAMQGVKEAGSTWSGDDSWEIVVWTDSWPAIKVCTLNNALCTFTLCWSVSKRAQTLIQSKPLKNAKNDCIDMTWDVALYHQESTNQQHVRVRTKRIWWSQANRAQAPAGILIPPIVPEISADHLGSDQKSKAVFNDLQCITT